jgi:hypothetical protein
MSEPVISSLALTTVDVDPYVEYTYTIPVMGETSLGFIADANFDLSIAGRVLTLKYTGGFLAALTEFPITLFASNSDGTTELVVTFRIPAYTATSAPDSFTAAATNTSADLAFGSTISDKFMVGDVVKFKQTGGSGGNFDGLILYVVAVSGSNFQVSATSGGGAITATSTATYIFTVAVTVASSDVVYSGDTAELAVDEPIAIYDSANAVLVAAAYVKQIVDGYHVKVAATPGGLAITATANAFSLANVSGWDDLGLRTYPRAYPVITSAHFLTVTPREAVAYAITEDVAPDLYQVKGLPVELRLVDDDIVGVAPDSGTYAITIMARLGIVDSLRQLVLIVHEI